MSKPDDIRRMFSEIKSQFGSIDVLVSNARGELPGFYAPPLEIGLEQFEHAFDSQARAFHLCVREMVELLNEGQEGGLSGSVIPRAGARAVGSRGWRWDLPKPQRTRWRDTMQLPWHPEASP